MKEYLIESSDCENIFIFNIIFFSNIFTIKGVIEGKVIDEKTGEAIPGANVKIKGTYYGAASNFNGEYKILNINSGSTHSKLL